MTPLSSALHDQPYAALADLRRRQPVAFIDEIGGWLITSHQLAEQVLRDEHRFTVADPRFSTAQVVGPSMLSTDGDQHRTQRQAFSPMFRQRNLVAITERARALADSLVSAIPADGADAYETIALPFATTVIRDHLGIDVAADRVADWYGDIVAAVNALSAADQPAGPRDNLQTKAAQAMTELGDATQRAAARPGSPLSPLVADGLDATTLTGNTAVVLFGAIETTAAMIVNALHHLFIDPIVPKSELAMLRTEPDRLAAFVNESLRLEPAAAVVHRYATGETVLGDVAISAGDFVEVSLTAANRDPGVFAEPDTLWIERPNTVAHLSFVPGPHACIGARLATIETIAVLDAVLTDATLHGDRDRSSATVSGRIFRRPAQLWLRR